MSFAIEQRIEGGVAVLELAGRLNLGHATDRFRTQVHELLAAGYPDLLLDLSQVFHIDSAGLGEIVAAYKAAERAGGNLKLLSPPAQIQELMRATNLVEVFEVFEEEKAAIGSYRQPGTERPGA